MNRIPTVRALNRLSDIRAGTIAQVFDKDARRRLIDAEIDEAYRDGS